MTDLTFDELYAMTPRPSGAEASRIRGLKPPTAYKWAQRRGLKWGPPGRIDLVAFGIEKPEKPDDPISWWRLYDRDPRPTAVEAARLRGVEVCSAYDWARRKKVCWREDNRSKYRLPEPVLQPEPEPQAPPKVFAFTCKPAAVAKAMATLRPGI